MTIQELGQTTFMTGFSAIRGSDQKSGVITAAHCATPNQITIRDSGGSTYNLAQGLKKQDNFGDIMFLSGTPTATAQFRYDWTGYLRTVCSSPPARRKPASRGGNSRPGLVAPPCRHLVRGARRPACTCARPARADRRMRDSPGAGFPPPGRVRPRFRVVGPREASAGSGRRRLSPRHRGRGRGRIDRHRRSGGGRFLRPQGLRARTLAVRRRADV